MKQFTFRAKTIATDEWVEGAIAFDGWASYIVQMGKVGGEMQFRYTQVQPNTIEPLERALNDTTLEIVKRKRDSLEKEPWWPASSTAHSLAINLMKKWIDEIITEAEAGK
jgi:hypothetical protein